MNPKLKLLVIPALLAGAIWTGTVIVTSATGTLQPGSVDDPLVTKSYLEEQLRKLTGSLSSSNTTTPPANGTPPGNTAEALTEGQVKELIAAEAARMKQELSAMIPAPGNGSTTPTPPTAPSTGSAASNSITVVKLETNQILYAGAGAELIVRTGKTVAVSNDDGIPDVTAGKDIPAGTVIDNNHLLVFPREGRGIKADPKNIADIYVMIKGSYILLNQDNGKAAP